ncbi:MAG: ATP-dependent metalloprotease FtsH, cell division protease FtsH [Patescibacteria group bacterium]|nr:ATP-dependent metalloprotease FtsH, cell division protease FtsH [Patescibacteria group bacterium]
MKLKKNMRGFLFLVTAILVAAVLLVISLPQQKVENVALSKVIDEAKSGKIERIEVDGDKLTASLKDTSEPKQVAYKEKTANLSNYGIDYSKVTVDTKNPDNGNSRIFDVALTLLPILLIIGFFYFMMRQAQGQGNQAMNFGKSRARLYGSDKKKVTFKEVAGADEAKQELTEIVEFLKFPSKFEALGAKIPKGVLLFGPPGTGKTLLARAVAGEAGVPFFSIAGSDFVEMFVGVGASRVRDLFMKAKKNAPCIIFIDEIDAVGRQRGTGMGGGHDEREQTLNQILVEMDGFEQGTNVIVIAATNRPDVLDPALLRPGRFDRRVTLDSPDLKSRVAILEVHSQGKPLAGDADLEEIAKKTPGFSGADLENLLNEAAILAARLDQKTITRKDLNSSVEKVLMGPERKTHVMNVKEKEITAYHEAGHSIVAHMLPAAHPVNKVSIISRGRAGGFTWQLPAEDRHLTSVADYKDDLAVMLGGRMAEKIVFGDITNGASNDLQKASQMARHMIMDNGMSTKLSNRVFGSQSDAVFLGRDLGSDKNYSEEVAKIIDEEVADLIDEAAKRAGEVIEKNRAKVDKIAAKLVKDEVIDRDEFTELIGPRPHEPKKDDPRKPGTEDQDIAPDISGKPTAA